MTADEFDHDSIGPELTLADLRLPPHVGERLAALYGRSGRITTGAEWVDAMRDALRDLDVDQPTEEDLCTDADGNHTVEVDGDRQSYVCVLDPLVVPFLRGTPGTVTATTPTDGETVTIDVTRDHATATPETAVVSLGVEHDAGAEGDVTHETVYRNVCPYIHAFASVDEYERWDATVDASTTVLPVETGVAVARDLADSLFGTPVETSSS